MNPKAAAALAMATVGQPSTPALYQPKQAVLSGQLGTRHQGVHHRALGVRTQASGAAESVGSCEDCRAESVPMMKCHRSGLGSLMQAE